MKKPYYPIFIYAILFLFFIQMAGILVSSIYTLDLLNTSLDAKALGLLFFFSPVVLILFRKQPPGWWMWFLFVILLLARGLTPSLDTNGKMLVSGLGTAAVLCLFATLVTSRTRTESLTNGIWAALGLALTVAFSTMLRTMNSSIDYSLTPAGSWVGWVLGLLLGVALTGIKMEKPRENTIGKSKGLTSSILGIFMVLTLVYFVFSAPAVLARWTEGSYVGIVMSICGFSVAWFLIIQFKPGLLKRVTKNVLIGWNLVFTIAMVGTTLAHRIQFPAAPQSSAVVVGSPAFWQQIPLIILLLSFPVIFFDIKLFWNKFEEIKATPSQLVPGMLLGGLLLVVIIFMNIFTNVWGYVEPVSPFFRNKFWLPYLLICGLLCLLVMLQRSINPKNEKEPEAPQVHVWGLIMVAILVVTTNGLFVPTLQVEADVPVRSLKVMTYNIQQANDQDGEQSYLRQLALIQQVDPDLLALQESDSTRISLNNNDYVRYYADKLGYHTYYGPTTITGGYGTAILSRYPLENTLSIFTYSDQDENGTAEVQIEAGGKFFSIFNIHPDGSDEAKMAIVKMLLERTANQANVVILGDFNMRDTENAYHMIDSVFTNAWMSNYPTGISSDGVDMSGRNRIDHIFVSKNLMVRDPVYLLPPASATDHPVHWAEIHWEE